MRKIVALIVAVALILAIAFLLLGRPTQVAVASSDPDVTIECDGTTSVSAEACRQWGDETLALGAPSTTFELEDVERLRFTRPLLGFGAPCQVAYFLQRYPDDPAWESDTPCPSG